MVSSEDRKLCSRNKYCFRKVNKMNVKTTEILTVGRNEERDYKINMKNKIVKATPKPRYL